jgi:hypothetical protein
MDATLSILSSLSAAFVAGVAVAMNGRSTRAPNANANAPGNRRNDNENSPGRYPTPSAPPASAMKNANSGTSSAASRYTKNYGGSSRRVTFASSPPTGRRGGHAVP